MDMTKNKLIQLVFGIEEKLVEGEKVGPEHFAELRTGITQSEMKNEIQLFTIGVLVKWIQVRARGVAKDKFNGSNADEISTCAMEEALKHLRADVSSPVTGKEKGD